MEHLGGAGAMCTDLLPTLGDPKGHPMVLRLALLLSLAAFPELAQNGPSFDCSRAEGTKQRQETSGAIPRSVG